ncbi:MAG TPA: hypothetical protein VKU00_32320 [Chthonomonadaceae bacterium]|nr:hypothetical protein [Chthonomonadaceae bacterium]
MKSFVIGLAACALCLPGAVLAQNRAEVVSRGARFEVKTILKEESTTIVLFLQDTSVIEQQFLTDLEKQMPKSEKVVLDLVRLKDLSAPAAQQYKIQATPTAVIYDRFGREIARTSQPEEIQAAVRKGQLMARIQWIDEDDPRAPNVYGAPPEALKRGLPGIVKTMALRPEAFKMFNIMSEMHFSDGFLKRREHEMIAAYVSSLNKCKF